MAIVIGQTSWHGQAVCLPRFTQLGCAVLGGGRLICKNGGTAWIVAPSCSDVARSYTNRNDAVTTATACTTATGWFIPTLSQLQNPGFCCRTHWDEFFGASQCAYWSDTSGCFVMMVCGVGNSAPNTNVYRVRALRCVTY
jgi:hypothetical protein